LAYTHVFLEIEYRVNSPYSVEFDMALDRDTSELGVDAFRPFKMHPNNVQKGEFGTSRRGTGCVGNATEVRHDSLERQLYETA
jgi:hypothetical protein